MITKKNSRLCMFFEPGFLGTHSQLNLDELQSVDISVLHSLREAAQKVHISEPLLDYMQEILAFTRQSGLYSSGLSTRGALTLSRLAKAWALLQDRAYVIPSDIAFLLPFVTAHRIKSKDGSSSPSHIASEKINHDHQES